MGNSPLTSLRNGDKSYNFAQLGGSASIYVGGKDVAEGENGEISDTWLIRYNVSQLYCTFILTKVPAGNNFSLYDHHRDEKLVINIFDKQDPQSTQRFTLTVRSAEAGGLINASENMNMRNASGLFLFDTSNAGGITRTLCHVYGIGTTRGLIIREWTSKSKDDASPYMLTIRHYYASVENGNDVGLSVAVKRIRVSNDGFFDYVVDGPHQHPANALFYMFDQVNQIKTWKPTFCPHCANALIQKHGISWQSESEDSDVDNVPATAPLLGSRQNAGGILSNGGRFRGNHNGNLNIKYFNARRR